VKKYGNLSALGDAWRVPVADLGSFDAVPLPSIGDLRYERYGNVNQVRALDYNLFAQDMFSAWVKSMVSLIRSSGSNQLIDIGQDEGGVTDRVLNQFYSGAGVSFYNEPHLLARRLAAVGFGGSQAAWNTQYHGRNRISASLAARRKLALR